MKSLEATQERTVVVNDASSEKAAEIVSEKEIVSETEVTPDSITQGNDNSSAATNSVSDNSKTTNSTKSEIIVIPESEIAESILSVLKSCTMNQKNNKPDLSDRIKKAITNTLADPDVQDYLARQVLGRLDCNANELGAHEMDLVQNSIQNSMQNSVRNSVRNSVHNSGHVSVQNANKNSVQNLVQNSVQNSAQNSIQNTEQDSGINSDSMLQLLINTQLQSQKPLNTQNSQSSPSLNSLNIQNLQILQNSRKLNNIEADNSQSQQIFPNQQLSQNRQLSQNQKIELQDQSSNNQSSNNQSSTNQAPTTISTSQTISTLAKLLENQHHQFTLTAHYQQLQEALQNYSLFKNFGPASKFDHF